MKVKELKQNNAETEVESEPPQVPNNFLCIDQTQSHLVVDFLTDFDQVVKEVALTHLRLCLHCRELAQGLLEIKSGHYLHAEEKVVSHVEEDKTWGKNGEEDKEIDFA